MKQRNTCRLVIAILLLIYGVILLIIPLMWALYQILISKIHQSPIGSYLSFVASDISYIIYVFSSIFTRLITPLFSLLFGISLLRTMKTRNKPPIPIFSNKPAVAIFSINIVFRLYSVMVMIYYDLSINNIIPLITVVFVEIVIIVYLIKCKEMRPLIVVNSK